MPVGKLRSLRAWLALVGLLRCTGGAVVLYSAAGAVAATFEGSVYLVTGLAFLVAAVWLQTFLRTAPNLVLWLVASLAAFSLVLAVSTYSVVGQVPWLDVALSLAISGYLGRQVRLLTDAAPKAPEAAAS